MNIHIKNSWSDVTISDYKELQDIKNDLDVLFILTDLYTVNGLSTVDIQDIMNNFAFLSEKPILKEIPLIFVDGCMYNVKADIKTMTASQFIDLQSYLNDFINNLNSILSVVCIKNGCMYNVGYDIITLQEQINEQIDIITALSIYDKVNKTVTLITDTFTGLFEEKDIEDDDEETEKGKNPFNDRWGWVYLAEQVSKVKNCTIDSVFELNVLEFLNYCSYIKEKNDFEKQRIEEYKRT